MNKILRQIANTIVANLANTGTAGLFDGKMGVCLFLYKYARYSGNDTYEDIASDLIGDVFKQLKPDMSPSAIDGLASIGYGLLDLLKEGFLESDLDEDILYDIDEALLGKVENPLMKEMSFPIPLYSSGIYLLSRMSFKQEQVKDVWIAEVIENVQNIINRLKNKDWFIPPLSLLNSMLYTCRKLDEMMELNLDNADNLIKDILCISFQIIQKRRYKEADILLFKRNVLNLPSKFEKECLQLINLLEQIDYFSKKNCLDVWYDNLWWSILYDIPIVENISIEKMQVYITDKIRDSYFDEMTVNSKLSAIGIWLMSQK